MEAEVVEGFTFDRGYVSALMVTDTSRLEAVYNKPAVVITDQKVSSVQEFLPMLEKLAQAGKKDVVLIADEVEGEALGILVLNKLKGVFNTVAVKAPAFGDRRKEVLQDIATLTGATVISEEQGMTFENVELDVIGTARKVMVTKDNTTIVEGAGRPADIDARIKQVKSQAESATSEYDKENYEKRAAALSGKVAVIKVGGATETEIEEKKFRVDDAVAATKAALAEGIVPGGGVTLLKLGLSLSPEGELGTRLVEKVKKDPALLHGISIVAGALQAPFLILTENAGLNSSALLDKVQNAKIGYGVDVLNPDKGLVDLKAKGIVDPAAVTKQAIQNAVSIAATSMTMGALVVDLPEPEVPAAPGGMPGGMGF